MMKFTVLGDDGGVIKPWTKPSIFCFLAQIDQNHLCYPKEPSKVTFFMFQSLKYKSFIKFEILYAEGQNSQFCD